jgi:hypothetical protein
MDGGSCTVPGCGKRAVKVDHIVSRRNGGTSAMHNLRSLCADHDNQIKEDRFGTRRSGGEFMIRGSTVDGLPLDPNHPWNR